MNDRPRFLLSVAALTLLVAVSACAAPHEPEADATAHGQPYADWDERHIKALAPEEVDDLLAGRGAGYALAAELNHYPGPTHVLDFADQLSLSQQQRDAIASVKAAMQEEAQRLGAELVEAEAQLDAAFAAGEVRESEVAERTAAIAEIEAKLRATHLAAHVETKELLSDAQVADYDALRGYDADGAAESGGGEHEGQHGD